MARSLSNVGLLMVCLGLLSACGSDEETLPLADTGSENSLAKPDNVRAWAISASALAVYANVYQPIAVADGQATYSDPGCPVLLDDGVTLSIDGNCDEAGGAHWVGSATVARSSDGSRTLSLQNFGTWTGSDNLDFSMGTATLVRTSASHRSFEIHLDRTSSSGGTTTIDYTGEVDGDYDSPSVWSGSGTVKRFGKLPEGMINAITTDEAVDDATCSGQPVAGTTTLVSSDLTAVITYDGVGDCDKDAPATYTLNGAPKGKISGISCALAHDGSQNSAGPWLAWLVAVFTGRRLFRRRRSG
jgi:hypothetical protein